MENRKLDVIDLRILKELQADGRITNVELSRRAKITAPPCLRRMRALEKAGFVLGYHADLNGKAAQAAARTIRDRLAGLAATRFGVPA